MKHRATWAWIAAFAGGAVLWLVAAGVSGKREAWDSSIYWTVAYPLGIGLAGGLGYWIPEKPWRWGLAVMLAQALVLFVSGSDFGLLPLGLIVFSMLALPTVGVAAFMARFRLISRKF
ncbi:MAG: hypothetical protein ABS92_00430 [Thiobacillus sp. SCN 63-374]|mgnify:CR=1 FL=1|nr:MAG: hypothetical protein ABS92_00430 [Thiobacillus sp. SCN 63-374]